MQAAAGMTPAAYMRLRSSAPGSRGAAGGATSGAVTMAARGSAAAVAATPQQQLARDVRAMPIKLITVGKGNSKGAELFAGEWYEKIERSVRVLGARAIHTHDWCRRLQTRRLPASHQHPVRRDGLRCVQLRAGVLRQHQAQSKAHGRPGPPA